MLSFAGDPGLRGVVTKKVPAWRQAWRRDAAAAAAPLGRCFRLRVGSDLRGAEVSSGFDEAQEGGLF